MTRVARLINASASPAAESCLLHHNPAGYRKWLSRTLGAENEFSRLLRILLDPLSVDILTFLRIERENAIHKTNGNFERAFLNGPHRSSVAVDPGLNSDPVD